MKTLAQLLSHLTGAQLYGDYDPAAITIMAVTGDSRTVLPGTLFVAIAGGTFDGHRFLTRAAAMGAAAMMGVKSPVELRAVGMELPDGLPYIQVGQSRQALAICSAALYDFPSRTMTVIGITGTDGKTTTSTLLESILIEATRSATFPAGRVGVITTVGARICGQESDTGFHVTTPDAPAVQAFLAQMRDAGCQYAVVECTSHGLAQDRVAAIDFDVAAVTNITHEHIDWHQTRDAYVAAKSLLFRALFAAPPKIDTPKIALLNGDDLGGYGTATGSLSALQQALAEEAVQSELPVQVQRYGLATPAAEIANQRHAALDLYAADVESLPDATRFILHWPGGQFAVESTLIGEFNIYNVLCAGGVALALGVEPMVIQRAVATFAGVSGRMERIDCGQPFLALVDFAHSPASLERALTTLRPLVGTNGRLIAVFGSAGLRDVAKRRLMGNVSGRLADFTVITAEDPRTEDLAAINRAIASGVLEYAADQAFTIVPDRTEAIQYAVDMAGPGDVVAAFGKGHERSMCFGETEYPWSDQDAMRAALIQRFGR